MKTLIELYDERPLENVLACQVFKPERTLFLCPGDVKRDSHVTGSIVSYLRAKGHTGDIRFYDTDMYDTRKITETLNTLTGEYEECVVDITGGTDQALFAAGMVCNKKGVPAFTYSRRKNSFFSVKDAPFGYSVPCELKLTVEDCFLMAGGSVRKGRVDNNILGKYMGFFKPFFDVYVKYRTDWTNIVRYFQSTSAPKEGVISLDIEAPYSVKADRGYVDVNASALEALRKMGFLKDVSVTKEKVCYTFRDAQVRTWLRDIGSVLETYVYKVCCDMGIFDDVCTSVVVDWEGDGKQGNVTNELDVMCSQGVTPVFISCKTCEIKTEALNELSVLRDRFGGKMARAAIVSSSKCQAITRHRADELNITVIDLDDLKKNRMSTLLTALMKPIA